MDNLLLSAAIGDISGVPYEFSGRTKDYDAVNLLLPGNTYSDDTVCTFACAEALLDGKDMAENLRKRCREEFHRGYGGRFYNWISSPKLEPAYGSYGNGSAMQCSSAGFLAKDEEDCIRLATLTSLPTHNHPEGIKGAVATALAIHYALRGENKEFIRQHVLEKYYPQWKELSYAGIKPDYFFDETCQRTVPAALICLLEGRDFSDVITLAISLGGDADTLAAISAPMAYALYRTMPQALIDNAKKKLPEWMLSLNDRFDAYINSQKF